MKRSIPIAALSILAVFSPVPTPGTVGEPCSTSSWCDSGEYCEYPWGICHSEEPLGSCATRGDVCGMYWDPVCGCDLQTHTNEGCAAIEGVSILHDGECGTQSVCGGYVGIACPAGEYCATDPGECGVYFGACEPSPTDCPESCEPVCGCDGLDYTSACEARAVGVEVLEWGACESTTDRLISGVSFASPETMVWDAEEGALSYSVYRKVTAGGPPGDAGFCLPGLRELPHPTAEVFQTPAPGEVHFFLVVGNFDEGEGPLGNGSDCRIRVPLMPC